MDNRQKNKDTDYLALAADIVSAYVANNRVAAAALPDTIRSVFSTLAGLEGTTGAAVVRPEPAVPIAKSITPDYIVCLEDGEKLKMLKRHLKARYAMSPEDYRRRWNLPDDYPMVAPNYSNRRRRLAKRPGLGKKQS